MAKGKGVEMGKYSGKGSGMQKPRPANKNKSK